MSDTLIIIIGIICIVAFIICARAFIYNKWANRGINLLLFASLFFLPDSIASICFILLVVRLGIWLFGPAQDMQDDYRYTRYRNAKRRYEDKMHKARMDEFGRQRKINTERRRKEREKNKTTQNNSNVDKNYLGIKSQVKDYIKKITEYEDLTTEDRYTLAIAYRYAIENKNIKMINKLENVKNKNDITKDIIEYEKEMTKDIEI